MNAEALQYISALSPRYQDQSSQVGSSLDCSLMLHAVSALYCQRYHQVKNGFYSTYDMV